MIHQGFDPAISKADFSDALGSGGVRLSLVGTACGTPQLPEIRQGSVTGGFPESNNQWLSAGARAREGKPSSRRAAAEYVPLKSRSRRCDATTEPCIRISAPRLFSRRAFVSCADPKLRLERQSYPSFRAVRARGYGSDTCVVPADLGAAESEPSLRPRCSRYPSMRDRLVW